MEQVVVVSAARTPLGAFQGALAAHSAPELGAVALRSVLERSGVAPELVDEVVMGCVLPAGLGQAPSRQAALQAGYPLSVACTGVSKVCGSGMKAVIMAADAIAAGSAKVVACGGMESMSNAPYLLPKARSGYRLGHGQMLDHMFFDGLEDHYERANHGRLMGSFAEDCASAYHFSRAMQDDFARASTEKARSAAASGGFDWELAPMAALAQDEGPLHVKLEKIPSLKPAFAAGGTVTAANSSSIADGAAALMLCAASSTQSLGLAPIARIVGYAGHAQAPHLFTTAPVGAITTLLRQVGWQRDEVARWEINEAFAVVTLAAITELALDPAKVNVHGGACALGHPIGASGARIVVSLLGALTRGQRGIASLCIGGGEALALALEKL